MKVSNKTILYWILALLILVLAVSILIGVSGYLVNSSFSAIYFGAILLFIPLFIYWLKKPDLGVYAIIFISLIPYGLIPTGIYDYLYKAMAILAPLIWLFSAIRRREKVIFSIPAILMLCFLLWSLVTLLWNNNTTIGLSFLQIYLVRVVVFLFLIPNLARTEKGLNGLMSTLALSGWVLVIASVYSFIDTGYSPGMRLKVFSENENGIGILALISLAGVAWKALNTNGGRVLVWKILAFIYLLAIIAITAASGSRGSAISVLVTLAAFWIWKPTRVFGKVSLVYLLLVGVMAPLLFTTIRERFTLIDQANTLLGGREVLWSAAWLYIRNNPWFGVGLGNSNFVLLSYLQLFRSTSGLEYASVHNPVLTIWMETGIPGLICYLGTLLCAVSLFIRQYVRTRTDPKGYLYSYFGIVASVFIGYMLSWIKGGGEESSYSYFLLLALLILPVYFAPEQISDHS